MTEEMKAQMTSAADDTSFTKALALWRSHNSAAANLSFDTLPSWAQSEIMRGAQILKSTGDEIAARELFVSFADGRETVIRRKR